MTVSHTPYRSASWRMVCPAAYSWAASSTGMGMRAPPGGRIETPAATSCRRRVRPVTP